MKLIRCKKCNDVVRLIHKNWRTCECGKSGGQYNDDMLSATVGGKCEVIGIRNDYFTSEPFTPERIVNKEGEVVDKIIQGEYLGDVQIHRIFKGSGPRLNLKIEKKDDDYNIITFTDRRKFYINVVGNKMPKSVVIPRNTVGPSFKGK